MRTTKLFIILLGLLTPFLVDAQHCDVVIFPDCPVGGGARIGNGVISNDALKNSPACDTPYTIIQDAMFGHVTYVGSGGNLQEYDMYNYTTNTNCYLNDEFWAEECCEDSTGVTVCDTVHYMLMLESQCETPDDLFCCIPNNGNSFAFEEEDLLENDLVFIQENYPGLMPLEVFVGSILMFPDSGTLTSGPNNEALYTPNPGFMGVDSIVYEVSYSLGNNGIEEITICDEQTAYFIVEDCIKTAPDELTVAPGDTVYFNALANDYIEPDIQPPYMGVPDCQNPLPQIDSSSFTLLTSGSELDTLGNGELCFSSPTGGCFTYEYRVCSTVGVCAMDTITVKVWNYCEPVIDLGIAELYTSTVHAQNQVISSGTVPAGTNVSLKAGQCIRLDTGFNSDVNADLEIIIEDCNAVCCPVNPLSEPWIQPFVSDPIYSIEQTNDTNGDCVFRIVDACTPFELTTSYYDCNGNLICQTFQVGGTCTPSFLSELSNLILLKACSPN